MRGTLRTLAAALAMVWLVLPLAGCRKKPPSPVDVALTPGVAETGLAQSLATSFEHRHGVKFNLRVVPEGEALRLAQSGAVQVVLTENPSAAQAYAKVARLSDTLGVLDLAIFGPRHDHAHVHGAPSAVEALKRIASHEGHFCSAVDAPLVAKWEGRLWAAAGVDPGKLRHHAVCHGNTLTALREASLAEAYTLSDARAASGTNIEIKQWLEGTEDLRQAYTAILVDHTPRIQRDRDAEWFVQWLTTYSGREAVEGYRLDGVQPFMVRDEPAK